MAKACFAMAIHDEHGNLGDEDNRSVCPSSNFAPNGAQELTTTRFVWQTSTMQSTRPSTIEC